MFKALFFLHLFTAIFAIGPLVHLSTTASRGLRERNASATSAAASGIRRYAMASVLVVIFGFALMSQEAPWAEGEKVASFSDPYIWISTLLWFVACGIATGVIVPALEQATTQLTGGATAHLPSAGPEESAVDKPADKPVDKLVGKVAASGGVIGILFALIVLLMVYKPGS